MIDLQRGRQYIYCDGSRVTLLSETPTSEGTFAVQRCDTNDVLCTHAANLSEVDPPRRHVRASRRVIEHRWERIEAFIPFDVDLTDVEEVYEAMLRADLEVIDDEIQEYVLDGPIFEVEET